MVTEAEAGDHLVENQHRAVLAGELAQPLQTFARLLQQAIVGRQRFDDGRGDVLAGLGERPFQRRDVTQRNHQRVGRHLRRHAGAVRQALRDDAAARLDHEVIDVAVITAVELEDAAPPVAAARDAHRGGHGLGAADHEAHQLGVRIRREHALRELTFEPVRGAESEALTRRALHGFDHPRMRVTEDQRTPGHAQVEVTIAVFVDGMGAAGLP